MQEITFTKMNGSGNDFIIIDHRSHFLAEFSLPHFVQALCRRRASVGADGVIFIEPSDHADFKWRFFNADGSEAEMCGNGGRCVARFAYEKGITAERLSFETLAGTIHAAVINNRVRIQLPLPHGLCCNRAIEVQGSQYNVHTVTTGVPHAVLIVDNLEKVAVRDLGRAIRYHPDFHPAGTNVNFVQLVDAQTLYIRTYERGVEDETLACGTGSVASALIGAAIGKAISPVQVTTRGGEILTVSFQKDGASSFGEVYLEGDTCLVYEGTLGADIVSLYQELLATASQACK